MFLKILNNPPMYTLDVYIPNKNYSWYNFYFYQFTFYNFYFHGVTSPRNHRILWVSLSFKASRLDNYFFFSINKVKEKQNGLNRRHTSDQTRLTSGPTIPARYEGEAKREGKHLLKIGVLAQSLPLHGLKSFHNCNLSNSLETFSLWYFLCISSFFVRTFMFFLPPLCLVPEKLVGNATKWVENFESLIIAFILCFFL